ncbi:hypothetical protein Ddye_023706 [Dipteronia dyeriana]|uniref:Uncharacterized protein n=1 Tax=Dipteronia dyeriana TaxID=168575 RepID=A0AAD9WTH9_9ROSI|nr:hypothetical protein Ddye_023706 [Dipteronia dyeriana]
MCMEHTVSDERKLIDSAAISNWIMLRYPRNAAETECKRLKLNVDNREPLQYFVCYRRECRNKLLSHYRNAICGCGERMGNEMFLFKKESEVFLMLETEESFLKD